MTLSCTIVCSHAVGEGGWVSDLERFTRHDTEFDVGDLSLSTDRSREKARRDPSSAVRAYSELGAREMVN